MNKYSHIIFDFNGTVLNDVQAGIDSANILLSRRGLKTLDSIADYHRVFGFPIIDYYRAMGLDVDGEGFDALAHEWVTEYRRCAAASPMYDFIPEALAILRTRGFSLVMLSLTELSMLHDQLQPLGIDTSFDEILGLDNIYAESKVALGCAWMKRVKPRCAVLVGDTVHDFETASAMGIDCVLIAQGHQSRNTLKQCGVPVFDSIKELCDSDIFSGDGQL